METILDAISETVKDPEIKPIMTYVVCSTPFCGGVYKNDLENNSPISEIRCPRCKKYVLYIV